MLNVSLTPYVLFTTFYTITPWTITAYIFVNCIKAFAVQAVVLAIIFAETSNFDFAKVSHFFLCMDLIYAETSSL